MTLFDKVLINLHRGFGKFRGGAAIFSERIRFELFIIRGRIRMNAIREEMKDLHALIGEQAVRLREKDEPVESFEQFFKMDEVAHAVEELGKRVKELDEAAAEIEREQSAFRESVKQTKETAA